MNRLSLSILTCCLLLGANHADARIFITQTKADVVVYGGSAGGVIAAVAAAREGKSVTLIVPGKHIGGMVAGGLGATDVGKAQAIGGYSREFFDHVRDYYVRKYGKDSQQVKDCSGGFRFEPHVADAVFKQMLNDAKVNVVLERRLTANLRFADNAKRIESITISSLPLKEDKSPNGSFVQTTVQAKVFIDASYEGDLLALAKVSYRVGREAKAEFNETIAGVQKYSSAHQWQAKVSPFAEGKKLLPFVQSAPPGEPGAGDKKVQAYNFRLCMTQRADQKIAFPKPANYDANRYELLARYLAAKPDLKVGKLMNPVKVPNGKTDTNNNGAFSTDHIGANWDYPEADYETRAKIWQDHIDYTQGFLYFLANDPRVPKSLQAEMNTWGLAKDEFKDTANWPNQLYVREARRMVGDYFMTQKDIMTERVKADSIGLGSYNTDSHHVQRVVGPDGFVLNEGDFQVGVQPYAIPYRSLIPRAKECENLLVPVCMSASHVAYGTIRMEPVYMIMGQACGVAAAQAIDEKTSVQKIAVDRLTTKLKAQKAVLSPEGIKKSFATNAVRIDVKKLAGIVVDDEQAQKTGDWQHSVSSGPFVGDGYLHDSSEEPGKRKVRFTPTLPKAGKYEVRLFYAPHANRASNVTVIIQSADGEKSVRINQKLTHKGDGVRLGVFAFDAGKTGYVEVRNDGANGFVIADAVQWIPAQEKK
jgi:hypothetical protein